MGRDQAYGGLIFMTSVVVAIGYVVAYFGPYFASPAWWHEWAVGVPVLLFVLLVLVISMWIGWTMLTTPPPEPLELTETRVPTSSTEKTAKE